MSKAVVMPELDAPGKGLPPHELWVARVIVGWQARRSTRAGVTEAFARERDELLRLGRMETAESGRRRVLIKRLPGMEDSSRFWSVFMTLDHLRITTDGVTGIIASLAKGETPGRVVSTADVKPSPSADAGVIEGFERACDRFERTVSRVNDLRTAMKWAHPWFGPLDAARWHFFVPFHMRLHRRQIEAIRAGAREG